jgi:diadenosine tetraphosphate (Ap4A) HIT family hydrolase
MTTTSTEPCWFCQDSRGEEEPPGGWVYEDEHWVAGHAPATYGPRGLVILESRRHFLDAAEMTPEEAATFGVVLGQLTGAVHRVADAERVYTWASMKAHPHLHVWLVPWRPGDVAGIDRITELESQAITPEEAVQAAKELRAALA